MRKHDVEGMSGSFRNLCIGIVASAAMFLVACGGSNDTSGTGGASGAGGKSVTGSGGASATGTGGAAIGGAGGAGTTGAGGAATTGAGGAATTGAGGAGATAGSGGQAGAATGVGGAAGNGGKAGSGGAAGSGATAGASGGGGSSSVGGAAGSSAGNGGAAAAGNSGGAGGGAAGSGAVDAGMDVARAPATSIPAGPVDFGPVDCGSSGGTQSFSFTNSGNASLHYRASIAPGGSFSLQGAAADGSISGDVNPGDSATLTIVAGVVPTSTAAGAVLTGAMTVATNAAGADNAQVALQMTAQGNTCTLTCGSFTKCTPSNASPYCANTSTDNANCGTCGNTCTGANVCTGGVCSIACGSLSTCTPSSGSPYCANLSTDNANCGTCGNACGAGNVCSGGACTLTCGSLSTCRPSSGSPYCANLSTDDANCGTCGTTCAAGQSCMGGVCKATCSGGETVCGGVCTNTSFDPNNCGACGTTCGFANGTAGCSGGCFLAACNSGYADCNHLQADGCESNSASDPANCGACGKACALGETCQTGVCTANLSMGLLGYWKMDDAPGSLSAADSGPNNLPGAVQGNVTFVPGAGKQGSGAVSLGGAGYLVVQFPNDAKNDGSGVFIPLGNMTFSMWFKTATSGTVPGTLQTVEGHNWNPGCDRIVGAGSGSTLNYNVWDEVNMSGVTNINDGNWHLMTYVLDEHNGLFAYIDGVIDTSTTTPTSNCGEGCSGFNWADQYWIGYGASCRYSANYFSGLIDDVRMYDHVLSPTAVQQLYNATK
jgi:hypothetical protein